MTRLLLCGGLLLVATSLFAGEQTSSPPLQEDTVPRAEATVPITLDAEIVAAMQAEIDARIEAGQKAAQRLHDKTLTANGAERLALLEKTQELNASLHLDILRIQARHTRAAGFEEAAQHIEANIAVLIEARENPMARIQTQKVQRERPDAEGGPR